MLTDGILVGPEFFGHRLADEDSAGTTGDIGVVEFAPPQKRDAHRAQVAGADEAHVHLRLVGHGHHWPAFHLHRLMRSRQSAAALSMNPAERTPGKVPYPIENAVEEADLLGRDAGNLVGGIDRSMVTTWSGIEAGIDAMQRPQAANQQAGADQQHQRERDFGNHQHTARAVAARVGGGAPNSLASTLRWHLLWSGAARVARPAASPVSSEMPSVNANTQVSSPMLAERGSCCPINFTINIVP